MATDTVLAGTQYYREINAIWPSLYTGKALIAPPRNGVNRFTGRILQGWDHVEQSLEVLFATPFHERVLRRWVGSFVPHLLGESGVSRIITRFFWAIVTSIDLFEPGYRVQQVLLMGAAINTSWSPTENTDINLLFQQGNIIFRTEGLWFPRGHLGDFQAFQPVFAGLVSRGGNLWDVKTVP